MVPGNTTLTNSALTTFLRFCKLSNAQPYIAANLRSLTAKDFYRMG